MELDRKQTIYKAKYKNVVNLKDVERNTMHDLRTQVADRQRKFEELKKKESVLYKHLDKVKANLGSIFSNSIVDEESTKAKIAEVKEDIEDMVKYNSTTSSNHSDLVMGL